MKTKTVQNLFIYGSIDFENMNQAKVSFDDIGLNYYVSLTPSWLTAIRYTDKTSKGIKIITGSCGRQGDKVDIIIIKTLKNA